MSDTLTKESRELKTTVFNRDFLNEVGRYIGAPLSLGELFKIGAAHMSGSPSLRDYMAGAAQRFQPGTVQMHPRAADTARNRRFLAMAQSQGAPISQGGRWMDPMRNIQWQPQQQTGFVRNMGLDALGIIPRSPGAVSEAPGRDIIPTTRGERWDNVRDLLRQPAPAVDPTVNGKDPNRAEGDPPSDAAHGIPEGTTRRYSIADLTTTWTTMDLDKLGDVERVFRKAQESGIDIDMNNFTLGQFQDLVGRLKEIDSKLSARSISNFELALARLTQLARGEEGFDKGRGDMGPSRFADDVWY